MKIRFKFALKLLIAFGFSNFVNAQNTLDNIGLTSSTPASVAFSLRQLSTVYTGPLVRIKVGTSFYDVYPDSITKNFSLSSKISAPIGTYNATVSAASGNSLSTIITAGTTNATVAIWYDQSGNAVNVLNSATTGPKIITQGSIQLMSGKPSIYFAGGSENTNPLVSSTTVNYSAQQTATINAVAQNVGSTSNICGIYSTGISGGWGLNYEPTTLGYWLDGGGCNQAISGAPSSTGKIVTGFLNKSNSSSIIYENSILKGTKTITCGINNGITDKICIGIRAENGGTRKFDGYISEVILFPSILISADQGTLETNQNTTYFSPFVTITSSASSNSICDGTNVTFTANAQNFSSTPTYQWYKNGAIIPGATYSTYSSTTLTNNDVINVSCGNATTIVSDNTLSLWLDAGSASNVSGTTWTDLSGKGNHATFNSHQTYSSTSGGYFQFDGTANPVLINKVTSAITEVTMSAWVYITPGTTQGAFIKNGGSLGYTFGAGGGGGFCSSNFPGMLLAGQGWIGSYPPANNFLTGWQLCTMVVTGSNPTTYKYYINGTLANTATFTGALAPSGNYTALGDNYGDGGSCTTFNSKMGAVYIYTKALSQTEITQNYNASAARFGLSSSNNFISNSITTSVNALPSASISVSGDNCINKTTLSTTSGLTSYVWYKDNVVISSAISNSYVPTIAGDYKVQISNGTCSNTSTITTISVCGLTAEGKMIPIENSTTLVSKEGAINNVKGLDERGKILSKPWVYGTVTTITGRIWMDRNLGASRVALSPTDNQAYGDYYQWGRPADGHEKHIVSGTANDYTTLRSTSTVPVNNKYIFPSDGSNDWLITPDNTLWTGVNAANNPCPAGFRIPTEAEWAAEAAVFTSQNVGGSFEAGYGLKLPLPGMAGSANSITAIGNYGQYLTQTAYNDGKVKYFGVHPSVIWFDNNYFKITGQSCRCIKD